MSPQDNKVLDANGLAYLWKRIVEFVRGSLPKKISELENDMGYKNSGVDSVNGMQGNVIIPMPKKLSELQNDVGYITDGDFYSKSETNALLQGKQNTISDLNNIRQGAALGSTALQSYTETDPTVPAWAKESSKPSYTAQEVGALPNTTVIPEGIPAGGTTGQVLKKTSNSDYAVEWDDEEGGGGGGGQENVIEVVKVNDTALVVTDKAVNIDLTDYAQLSDIPDTSNFYEKPSTGIPASDLASGVIPTVPTISTDISSDSTSDTKTASPKAVKTFVEGKGYTTNTGTITGITMNGSSKGTSGVVDLGAVITDISGKQDKIDSSHKLSADLIEDGTTNKVINVKPDWDAASGADAEILNKPTIPAAGIPSGGNAGQVLKKHSADPYDVEWANQSETLPSAYCTTSGSTAAKKANCSLYVTQANQYLQVLIGSANTYQGALTLNINSAGSKPIYINGTVSSLSNYTLPNGTYFVFYDGTNYYFRTDGKIQGLGGTLVCTNSTTGLLKNDGTVDTSTYLTQHQDISGKEDKIAIDSTAKTASFTASVGNYYKVNIAASVSVTITLTTPTDSTKLSSCIFFVTTSTSPSLTFASQDSADIYKSTSYSIEASKVYEINAMWNGSAWCIASVEMEVQS